MLSKTEQIYRYRPLRLKDQMKSSVQPLPAVDAQWLAQQIGVSDANGITAGLVALIASNRLASGVRLPTLRDLATCLATSPSTLAASWGRLRSMGLIETHRRGGTVVVNTAGGTQGHGLGEPLNQQTEAGRFEGWASIDLSRASADPALLPDLTEALMAGLRVDALHDSERSHMLPALLDTVQSTWPGKPESWTTASGGTLGVMLALQVATKPGDTVAIENPTSSRLVNILADLGLKGIPVACDAEGPRPDSLAEALRQQPAAFVYQVRAQTPIGHSVSEARRQQLADVIDTLPGLLIVEDDHLGMVSAGPIYSLCERFPHRAVLVRSYCRAFGVDLRIAVLGGSARVIKLIDNEPGRRVATTSRILQGALAYLLKSHAVHTALELARTRYAQRRHLLAQALSTHGIPTAGDSGLSIWVPVIDETASIVRLARQGVVVGIGEACFLPGTGVPHIRITTSRLPDDPTLILELAEIIADATRTPDFEDFD